MRTNFLLGTAAVGLLITGAIAQTSSSIERIKDPASQQTEPKKNVRTVYPNTQNAEQAIEQSKTARGGADASKRPPGDVTPLSSAQQSSAQVGSKGTTQPGQSAQQAQQSAQTPSPPQSAPAAANTSAPNTQSAPAASQPAPTQTVQPATPAQPSAAPAAPQQSAPTATAQQSSTPSETAASQPSRPGSTGVVALDTQQQTSIGQTIAHHNVKPITDVTFSIAVGTKVPTAVQLRALPSDVATFIPQYRGYSYVAVEEQIVVVDPGSHEIVAIVPYTAAAPATRTVEPAAPPTRTVQTEKPRAPAAQKPAAPKPVAQKPMISRSVSLHTEEKREARRPPTERKTTRSVGKREYREERAPRTVTVEEEEAEPRPVPVQRGSRFFDDDDEGPRPGGFFGFFR